MDLQNFTNLEKRLEEKRLGEAIQKDSHIEKLEMELKIAREEAEKYRKLSFETKVNGTW